MVLATPACCSFVLEASFSDPFVSTSQISHWPLANLPASISDVTVFAQLWDGQCSL